MRSEVCYIALSYGNLRKIPVGLVFLKKLNYLWTVN
jgi:hypothetical protein